MGSLNSNIHPSWLTLMTGGCFIMSRKLGRTSTNFFFLICIHHLLDSCHSRLTDISSLPNVSNRISLFKQRDDKSAQVAAEVALVVVVKGWVKFQQAKVMQIISHDIFYCYHSHLEHYFFWKSGKKWKMIDAHKTVPMSCNFVLLITPWVFIKITWPWVF